MRTDLLPPVHPGKVLLEEFLKPLELSQYRVAKDINVPPRRINEIVHDKARDHRRHRAAVGPALRGLRAVLAEPASPVRPRRPQ